jgi:hypothetical protein
MKHTNILWAWLGAMSVTRCLAFLRTADVKERVSIDTEPSSHASPAVALTDSPSTTPHSISATPSFVSRVTNEPSNSGVVPDAPTSPAPWPLNSPTVFAPIGAIDTDDAVDIAPSRTAPKPVHEFPTSPIATEIEPSPPSIRSWLTKKPSGTDETRSALEQVCTPIAKDAPRLQKLRVLSKDQVADKFVNSKASVATIELTVREEKSKAIGAFITVSMGDDTIFESDKDCVKKIDSNDEPAILKCDIKLPKEAPPGTYKIEVCVFAGGKKDFYSTARLEKEKEKLTFSFKVVKTDRL